MEKRGTPLDDTQTTSIVVDLLKEAIRLQKVTIKQRDILLLRTGWLGYYVKQSPEEQTELRTSKHRVSTPGLMANAETAKFLWDSGFAAVAADNHAVESSPTDQSRGHLHHREIPLMGMALGELFSLDSLADDCAKDGIYECMVVSVPLNLPGGVGSPANAIAIK